MSQLESTPQNEISIFKQNITHPCTNDHQTCATITRLSEALKHCHNLDIIDNSQHQEAFIRFINEVYLNLVNDYIHLHKHHGHQIEDIYNDFINRRGFKICDIKQCLKSYRHHRVISDETKQIQLFRDPNLEFHKQTMDGIHFYIFHS